MKIVKAVAPALAFAAGIGFAVSACAAGGGAVLSDPGAMQGKHFDPDGKLPSKYTVESQNQLRKSLPFHDQRDFDESKKGFVAAPSCKQIMADAGNVAWDMGSYEWLLAGNAMNRRMYFQYGVLLPRSPFGHVDQSIGKNTAAGNLGLIEPTRTISKDFEELSIDGVTMEFQSTPGTEAPAEMNTWFPQFKTFWAAENITGPDTLRGMSTGLWLDFLGIRLDGSKVEGLKAAINLATPDNGEQYVVELSNSTLTNIKGRQAKNPDLTITLNRSDLEAVMGGKATLDELVAAGKARLEGNRKPLDQLRAALVQFTPDFEMMPGTKPAKPVAPRAKDPFEQHAPADTSGG